VRAIVVSEPGGPDSLVWSEAPDPVPGPGEVVVDVAASAVNRADLLQRQGLYPPPPGASTILGMECSGVISALGPEVSRWSVGDPVCALLAGGGYAEKVNVPAGQLLPVPPGVDLVEAAGLPEVACTVHSNLGHLLHEDELLLVHGGSSGIGTFATQYAVARGARVAVTAGSAEKLDRCRALGASILVNYRDQDFVDEVRAATDGRGADVILDNMGATYLARNIAVLAVGGRLVVIGMQGGTKSEIDLGVLLSKRASVTATALRSRPLPDKARIVRGVLDEVWPLVEAGRLHPVIDTIVPMSDAAQAHRLVDASSHVGKVLLQV
jgi:putative PIG3 family NAD(P)H quinone oxidoreductase